MKSFLLSQISDMCDTADNALTKQQYTLHNSKTDTPSFIILVPSLQTLFSSIHICRQIDYQTWPPDFPPFHFSLKCHITKWRWQGFWALLSSTKVYILLSWSQCRRLHRGLEVTAVAGLITSAGGTVGGRGALQATRSNHSFTPNTPGPRANTMHTARCTVEFMQDLHNSLCCQFQCEKIC